MKIILVSIHPYPSPQSIPLANAFLKTYLEEHCDSPDELAIELLDFFSEDSHSEALSTILQKAPDLIGFSIYLWNRKFTVDLVVSLRRVRPDLVITGGGPEATADSEGLLREAPFDFLVVGEGEDSFLQAINALSAEEGVDGLHGVAFLRSGKPFISKVRPIENLDSIPSPYLSGVIDLSRHGGAIWQLSRGCVFGCDYCFDSQGIPGVRYFTMERVRNELLLFEKNQVPQVFVIDSTFNLDKARAKKILRLIAIHAPHVHFHFEVRYDLIDTEMARLFAGIGCSLQIGLQSAHQEVNRLVNRRFDPDRFKKKIGHLNQTGAVFGFDLIYGLPGDSLSGFLASVDFSLALYPNHLDIFPLAVLPGTALSVKSDLLGLRHLPAPPYTLLDSPGFSEDDMAKAAGVALACDIFYSRGKAVAWFNSILSPLGISASSFLRRFREWLHNSGREIVDESDIPDREIQKFQREFISFQYSGKKIEWLLPAALDLIEYHWCYAEALMAVPSDDSRMGKLESIDPLDIPLKLAPGAKLAGFNFDIRDILDAGEIDLVNFVKYHPPGGSLAIVYPASEEVRCEVICEPYFILLTRLDGRLTPRFVAAEIGIAAEEARSFIRFCIEEGITIPP